MDFCQTGTRMVNERRRDIMKKKSAWTTPIMVLISQFLTGCGNHSVKMIGLPVTGGFSVFLTDITSKVKAAAAGHEILAAFIVCIAGLLVHFICAALESRTTGLYYAWGVYGRIKAFFFYDFVVAGLMLIGSQFIPFLHDLGDMTPAQQRISGLVIITLAILLYLTSLAKCPAHLRGRLFISMLVSGIGVTMKICLFFLPFIWDLTMPSFTKMQDGNGNIVYVTDDGSVYDGHQKIGHMTENNRYIRY